MDQVSREHSGLTELKTSKVLDADVIAQTGDLDDRDPWPSRPRCATLRGTGHEGRVMASNENEVQVGAQGRVVIPAALRKAMKLEPGDRLVVRKVGESLVLERREVVERRLRERFRHIPRDVSLADELIAERRAEAAGEAGEP